MCGAKMFVKPFFTFDERAVFQAYGQVRTRVNGPIPVKWKSPEPLPELTTPVRVTLEAPLILTP